MNNKLFMTRQMTALVMVWRSTGNPRMPLACVWVQDPMTNSHPTFADLPNDKTGGLRLCA
jgi:hypothetical protein